MKDAITSDRRVLLLGIASALGASCFFSINDSSIKFLSGGYALHQIVLIRSLIGFAVVLAILLATTCISRISPD